MSRRHEDERLNALKKKLADSELRLRAMLDSEPECVKLVSIDRILLEVNAAGLRMLEADSPSQVVGLCVDGVVAPEHRELFKELNEGVFRGESRTAEFDIIGIKGTRLTVETHAGPLRNAEGKIVAHLAVTHDITERKRSEERLRQLQKSEALGRLAGGVAHDFNNLLTIINGYTDIVMGDLDPKDPNQEYLMGIKKVAGRAASLTRQLLAFSRQQVLLPKVLDLNAVVTDTHNMLERLIGEDIHLELSLEPGLWRVLADPGQVTQVIVNLAVNARDAMANGGSLTIRTDNITCKKGQTRHAVPSEPGDYVVLTVTDTGCGMDAETLKQIFEPFFTTKQVGQGTGLGLSTVYGIVQQSGGDIFVESELGRGTTFHVYLPRTEHRREAQDVRRSDDRKLAGSETILLVEDEDDVRQLVRKTLLAKGYTVLEASNGLDALSVAEGHSNEINLVVTDLIMPALGGVELVKRLLPIRPDIKVLYVSGYAQPAALHQIKLGTGMAFLPKPFTVEDLTQKMRELLD